MVVFPNAKINLGLNVVSKRNDGYHEIESVFYPIPLCDALEFVESQSEHTTFHSEGISIPSNENDNLVLQAYGLLKAKFDLPPIDIVLLKKIPIGAGMGGGSADASFMLTMLNSYFKLGISISELEAFAKELGADCPFFIENKPKLVKGIGDKMTNLNIDIAGKHLWVINPEIHISTKTAYSGIKPKVPNTPIEDIITQPVVKWRNQLHNDFEDSIFPIYPEIKSLKEWMYNEGALYASMTGSGSTVFGIFSNKPSGEAEHPNWKINL